MTGYPTSTSRTAGFPVLVDDFIPPGEAFIIGPTAFDPPLDEDPVDWMARHVAHITGIGDGDA